MPSRQFAEHVLRHAKVAVVPGNEFGFYGEGFVRASYATSLPKITEAIARLEKELAEIKKSKAKSK